MVRSRPAEKAFPRADRIIARTFGSEVACLKTLAVWRICLLLARMEREVLEIEGVQGFRSIEFFCERTL